MPADPRQTARLRELHQDFAWKVNAAVAAGRADLIDSLCEEYAEEAVRLLTGTPPPRPTPRPAATPAVSAGVGWWGRGRGRRRRRRP